jgi:hypothetical protein
MQLIDKTATLNFFNAPGPAELEAWCQENNFGGVNPTQDTPGEGYPSDYVLAAALWWAQTNHPDADTVDICSFGGMVAYFATGWSGGFGTDWYHKEPQSIVVALAGGQQLADEGLSTPSAEFTERALKFLNEFYFIDERQAVAKLMAQNAIAMIRAGEVLAPSQIASLYGITARAVQKAVKEGKLTADEYTEIPSGYLITRGGAARVWGSKEG